MTYNELKKKHRKEFDNFEMFFAFSDGQFLEGMKSIGLGENDLNKIKHIGGGGYVRKENHGKLLDMAEEQVKELAELMGEEKFFKEALAYELANHEYCITGDVSDAMDALGLKREEVAENKNQREWLKEVVEKMN